MSGGPLSRIALAMVGLVAGLLAVELTASVFRFDDHVLALSFLYYGWADTAVHQISSDPFLHYELKPASHCEARANPWTLAQDNPYAVNIDEFGARFPTHRREKDSGVFRILAFGGSTLYGANISDQDTLPAALERRLNRDFAGRADTPPTRGAEAAPQRFEVWNFGTSAYNLAQVAHLARAKLPVFDPDLIVVQVHNRGARSFFLPSGSDRVELFRKFEREDVDLLDEQFVAPRAVPEGVHRFAIRHSSLYRIAMGVWRRLGRDTTHDGYDLSRREAKALTNEAQARRIPIVFVAIPSDGGAVSADAAVFPGLAHDLYIDLFRPGRERLFYDVHPPPALMDEWAGLLAESLKNHHLLPIPE